MAVLQGRASLSLHHSDDIGPFVGTIRLRLYRDLLLLSLLIRGLGLLDRLTLAFSDSVSNATVTFLIVVAHSLPGLGCGRW